MTGGQTGDEPINWAEVTQIEPEQARSTVDFGPFVEVASGSAISLVVREAVETGTPQWSIEYHAGMVDEAGVNWVVTLRTPGEDGTPDQASFAPAEGDDTAALLTLVARTVNGSQHYLRAVSGRAAIRLVAIEERAELELDGLEFKEQGLLQPDADSSAILTPSGRITGELDRACAYLVTKAPAATNNAGAVSRPAPEWMFDPEWSSDFCTRLSSETP